MKKRLKRYHLFHGELTDAPGRNEVWDDYLIYRSNGQWELITESTQFSGTSEDEPNKEIMGSGQLLTWTLERDSEIGEKYRQATLDEIEVRKLGPFTERLNEIAIEVGSDYCCALIARWQNGGWNPGPKAKKLIIQNVSGVAKRGVWIKIFHCVYLVDTNMGPAYMYEPASDGHAKVVLKADSSMSQGVLVKVSRSILSQIRGFQADMDLLKASCE